MEQQARLTKFKQIGADDAGRVRRPPRKNLFDGKQLCGCPWHFAAPEECRRSQQRRRA